MREVDGRRRGGEGKGGFLKMLCGCSEWDSMGKSRCGDGGQLSAFCLLAGGEMGVSVPVDTLSQA